MQRSQQVNLDVLTTKEFRCAFGFFVITVAGLLITAGFGPPMNVTTVPTANASLQTGFYPLQDPRACCTRRPWTGSIEQDLRADYVGVHEGQATSDRAVDVALGRVVRHH